jgi:UDP-N-acetylmuramoyl-L-alanyl-D-glutamate--2,6-diaminopimelate ligase
MNLAELLDGIVEIPSKKESEIDVKGITLDSRKVTQGFVFVAIKGHVQHGLVHTQQAIDNGASAIIYEFSGSDTYDLDQLTVCQVVIKELGLKLGFLANRFYQAPSRHLDVIGITGTNGKTTCSQFLLQLIPASGVIGTLGWGEKGNLNKIENTTPDVITVHQLLAEFVSKNKKTVVMEVSSHGLQQGRVDAVCFKTAVFTNLSRDHLDYHGSMNEYLEAKIQLFKQPGLQYVVVNTDDAHSSQFLAATDRKVKRWAFSGTGKTIAAVENVVAEKIKYGLDGISGYVRWRNERALIQTVIVGDFNLENILAVMTILLAQGYSLNDSADGVNRLLPITGRMERFGGEEMPYVFVDFAHTPDAMEKVLQTLRGFCRQKLWLVFGCGGNRDKGKRAAMGAIAANYAEQIIVTTDNPRFEDPQHIINDITVSCSDKNMEVIEDRELAIQTAIKRADKEDCIVIAGKGHEAYQDIKGIKTPFSDQEIVQKALQRWK